jgi:hypothetical protein
VDGALRGRLGGVRGYEGVSGGVQGAFCVRNGSGLAEKWTTVSPWMAAVKAVTAKLGKRVGPLGTVVSAAAT